MDIHLRTLLVASFAVSLALPGRLEARAPDKAPGAPKAAVVKDNSPLGHRNNCDNATSTRSQNTNNVRALLTTGGDVWWNGREARYIVPNVAAGETEVSSIFAGAVWLGGKDPDENLKVAAQQYGRPDGEFDFYPGPLNPEGITNKAQCTRWDTIFAVTASEILEHQRLFQASLAGDIEYTADMIPRGVKGWPSKGNPYFELVTRFPLPDNEEPLAGFFDYFDEDISNVDGNYDPLRGDFPVVEIEGCTNYEGGDLPQFPDEMFFWIYNDNGNVHRNSGSTRENALSMEVQVQSFAYSTNDALNDMTFQRYRLINRGKLALVDTYFAMWVDADLGCSDDDYVGCDTTRSLAYYYNIDPIDGQTGAVCGATPTYGSQVPMIGIDYFRGPKGSFEDLTDPDNPVTITRELGMSSFTYFQRSSPTAPVPPGMQDPTTGRPGEFYNLISGRWRDGTPYTASGNGYRTTGPEVKYAFPADPDLRGPGVWSACADNIGEGDRRTIQASGPFVLSSGAVNELIIGLPWVPDVQLPCPDMTRLFDADDLAQNLFDNCFDITDGPNAPDIDIIELDQELVLVLTNDGRTSNNAGQRYSEVDLLAPNGVSDSLYRFEGYKVYQLRRPDVSDLNDPSQARLVFQTDLKNGVGEIYNWRRIENPNDPSKPVFEPVAQVESGAVDRGISTVFRITNDQFAQTNTRLRNHTPYYFKAVTYAYNNYRDFDPLVQGGSGQARPYLEGRRNVKTTTGVPRPITNTKLTGFDAAGVVTRLDGLGTSNFFLDLATGERTRLLENQQGQQPLYKDGRAPIDARVYNPFVSKNGVYQIFFSDDNMADDVLNPGGTWRLTKKTDAGDSLVIADQDFSSVSEVAIGRLGFSIRLGQVQEPGADRNGDNGCIGSEVESLGEGPTWYGMVPNKWPGPPQVNLGNQVFNFAQTVNGEGLGASAVEFDPVQSLTNCFSAEWLPFKLTAYQNSLAAPGTGGLSFLTPMLRRNGRALVQDLDLADLNNVDIVFTKDKSMWSRCVVVEMAHGDFTLGAVSSEGNANQFEPRKTPSVGKEAGPDGNPLPDDTGTQGFGWFPGYAIDVESGQRLNIFFGENSAISLDGNPAYDGVVALDQSAVTLTGRDMMFNPTPDVVALNPTATRVLPFNIVAGGHHFVYVTREPYDRCAKIDSLLRRGNAGQRPQFRDALTVVTYAGLVLPTGPMLPYADGLIPSDLVVKLRVNNPFQVATPKQGSTDRDYTSPTGVNRGYPAYQFTLDGVEAQSLLETKADSILSFINVVPNPYYGYSSYEISEFSNLIRITNLPARAIVTIYSLDGKFIRRYTRAEEPQQPFNTGDFLNLENRGIPRRQIYPDLDWDMKNGEGIPVASGTYLIHVDAGPLGQRTVKSFIIQRAFDPAGL